MPDCFISYSQQDQRLAEFIRSELMAQNLDVFLGSVSLKLGESWSETTQANLRASSCILFLASKAACQSAYVQQELGMALGANKRLIPVVWEIALSDLPGWVDRLQAFNLRGMSREHIQALTFKIAQIVREEKAKELVEGEGVTLLKRGIKLLEARAYEQAIDVLNQSINAEPLAPAINYYLALALLRGRRPRVLRPSEADTICQYLERACKLARPKAHYFYLWALVKFDFYVVNGFLIREPHVEDLLKTAERYPLDRAAISEMLQHTYAEDTIVELCIFERLNSM